MSVRLARHDERGAVVRLVSEAYGEFESAVTPENWARMTANLARVVERVEGGDLLVAEIDGRLVGTVTYCRPGPRDFDRVPAEWAVMRVLAVHPDRRGRGIGRTLAEECLNRARADKASTVGLHTAEMMYAARTMYERMGFERQREFEHLGITFLIYALVL